MKIKKFLVIFKALLVIIGCQFTSSSTEPSGLDDSREYEQNQVSEESEYNGDTEEKTEIDEPNLKDSQVETKPSKEALSLSDLGLHILKSNYQENDENLLVSPLSIIYALGMTANGAEGTSLEEVETSLGLKLNEINIFAKDFSNLAHAKEGAEINLANSIWFKNEEDLTLKDSFQKINSDYYKAKIARVDFSSESIDQINSWVKEETKGKIESIIDEEPADPLMYLINALSFEASWDQEYSGSDIIPGIFNKEDGTSKEVDFMSSDEYFYINSKDEKGFKKDYLNNSYSFVALLPNENIDMEDYLKDMDGNKLQNILESAEENFIRVSLPKFKTQYKLELNESLKSYGIKSIFNPETAELPYIFENEYPIYVSKVVHKTFIAVDEKGTQAGAATSVGVERMSAPAPEDNKLDFNRPFLYMIVDKASNLPIFMGTLMDIE